MKKHSLLSLFYVFLCLGVVAQDIPTDDPVSTDPAEEPEVIENTGPVFQEISVHDPSVIRVDEQYYIFGSHLSAAKSVDLMSWERVADLVTPENPLFEDVTVELSETLLWAQADTLWAPDVIRLDDGRFYFYYNACRGDSPRSALGVAVSDAVEGPYQDLGIILRSGMWGQLSDDGERVYDATIHPNVVDPDVFYDQEGRLWMVYGSYSGGIFILEMDSETGFPLPNQGYGKKLMGGNHQRIEGPYVLYSPHTGYYYLFVTYGGLDSSGGYNMRVSRSLTPDGPYLDSEGNDMILALSDTAFNDVAIAPYGVKLMGNYYYKGTFPYWGYMSPGHNSAYYDSDTHQYYLIFHTRFLSTGEYHEVRVHEMQFNREGWPVVSPLRYAPRKTELPDEVSEDDESLPEGNLEDEAIGDDSGNEFPQEDPIDETPDPEEVGGEGDDEGLEGEETPEEDELPPPPPPLYLDELLVEDIPGVYHFINHGKDVTALIAYSQEIQLHADGSISGEIEGYWILDEAFAENHYITIMLSEAEIYSGVLSIQWNEYSEQFVPVFSAVSGNGVSVSGVRWGDLVPVEE